LRARAKVIWRIRVTWERARLLSAVFLDKNETLIVGGTKLFVRVQQFYPIHRAVRRNVHVQLIANANRFDLLAPRP
jgi:hypothetical protein